MEKLLGLPPNASAYGADVDQLTLWVHILMAVLFVGWAIYFVYVLFRFRAGRNPEASYEGAKGKVAKYTEVGVAVIEAVLLIAFAIPAWALRVRDFPPEQDAEIVRVVAQQFAWNVHYPGPDRLFGPTDPHRVNSGNPIGLDRDDAAARDDVVAINQMRIPVGKPMVVYLSSLDVIHSFSLPQLRVKQDAIPGMQIPIWFEAAETTPEGDQWNIACAQLCGNSHYRMKGLYSVVSEEEYHAWLAERAPKPAPAAAPALPAPEPVAPALEGDDEAAAAAAPG